jgi:membrane-bound metal-dependent hydrolase YbcI (DUF457 family)
MIGGAITGLAVAHQLNLNPTETVVSSVIGAIIVDLDDDKSTINKLLFRGKTVNERMLFKAIVGVVLILLGYSHQGNGRWGVIEVIGAILILSEVSAKVRYKIGFMKIYKFEEHRTIFHDPIIGGVLFSFPLIALHVQSEYLIPYLAGVFSHYLLDSFTSKGLPLYLLGGKRLRMPITYNSSTNPIFEKIILTSYVVLIVMVFDPILVNNIENIIHTLKNSA